MDLKKHNLLTKEIALSLPMLYVEEEISVENKVVKVKFFTPTSSWTWYATEACAYMDDGTDLSLKDAWDQQDKIREVFFFGYVVGPDPEWGEFVLSELQDTKLPFGLYVERDYYFKPTQFKEIEKTNT